MHARKFFLLVAPAVLLGLGGLLLWATTPCGEMGGSARSVYILGSVTAAPGETVRVPFRIWSNREISWFCCSVRFDETVLEPTGLEPVWERPNGKPWADFHVRAEPFPCPVRMPGWAVFGVILAWREPGRPLVTAPSGVEIHFMDLVFRVLPDAKPGEASLRFEDYPNDTFGTYRNWAGLGMDEYQLSFSEFGEGTAASVLIPGTVTITADRAFRRGDANADGTLDLSDAVATLGYLFEGRGTAPCEDALDANDGGALDISDAVTALGYLFLGGAPPPAPSSDCGRDPTEDDLSCTQYAACP